MARGFAAEELAKLASASQRKTSLTEAERGEGLGRAMLAAAEEFARDMRSPWMYLHVALKKPGVVRLYRDEGYDVVGVDPGILGWRGRLLMRKSMGKRR